MTINIHGKEYTLVHERVAEFHKLYPNGSLRTTILKHESEMVITQSVATPDVAKPDRFFTGLACESKADNDMNQTAYVEIAETSSIGRALGFMGIGIETAIASADEVDRAISQSPEYKKEKKVALRKIDDMTPEQLRGYTIEFGKYKDIPLEVALGDEKYADYLQWLTEQPAKDARGERAIKLIRRFLDEVYQPFMDEQGA